MEHQSLTLKVSQKDQNISSMQNALKNQFIGQNEPI